jgi:hypothetical protein
VEHRRAVRAELLFAPDLLVRRVDDDDVVLHLVACLAPSSRITVTEMTTPVSTRL